MSKILFCTGHRPLNNDFNIAHPQRQKIREYLYPHLKRAYLYGGFDTFVSGMAQGFDTDFMLCALQLRLEMEGGVFLIAALPFAGQEQFWLKSSQEVFYDILEQCDSTVKVCDDGYKDWKYHARNQFMVDLSDEGICLWTGKSGGTKSCIKYALSKQKRMLNIIDYPVERASK